MSIHSNAASAADEGLSTFVPEQSFEGRRATFLAECAAIAGDNLYAQLASLAEGKSIQTKPIEDALSFIDARNDCADFRLHAILRLLYQFKDDPHVSAGLAARCRQTVLGFKYWPDEPGIDSMCTWSENHHILFASAGLLAGQLYPDAVFTNSGQTGRNLMEVHKKRVARWLDLRFRTGFSEWLSNVYYDEDLVALLNLVDFAEDSDIADRAAMITDLLFADIALNSYRGTFGSTHGRSYEHHKKWAATESTATAQYLAFGVGTPRVGSMSGTTLALSANYRVPKVLAAIANDSERAECVNRQRIGIRVSEGRKWGIGYDSLEDGMTWLSLEAYAHPKTINLTADMLDSFRWWENSFFRPFAKRRKLIESARRFHVLPLIAWFERRDLSRNTREQVDVYTYRTPDYMLSTAQDYRKGYGGDQQHIWQATLGEGAVCFTTHPAPRAASSATPNYWAGSATLPRAAQVENVCIAVYRLGDSRGLYLSNDLIFTHAWFPKDQFDDVIERDGWVLARRGDGYLALRSQQPHTWQTEEGEDKDREMIAPGRENIWVCELGRRQTDGSFTAFRDKVLRAKIEYGNARVTYESPSQGHLAFGWHRPLTKDGKRVRLHPAMRYDNPYMQTDFPADIVKFRLGNDWLTLDWKNRGRTASGYE